MARKKTKGTELSVFKGREAKLNRVIFQVLAYAGTATVYDIHKQICRFRGLKRTHYSSVNKRIKHLEESGYITKVATKATKAGFEASLYELRIAATLALMLSCIDLDTFLPQVSDEYGLTLLCGLINFAKLGK